MVRSTPLLGVVLVLVLVLVVLVVLLVLVVQVVLQQHDGVDGSNAVLQDVHEGEGELCLSHGERQKTQNLGLKYTFYF